MLSCIMKKCASTWKDPSRMFSSSKYCFCFSNSTDLLLTLWPGLFFLLFCWSQRRSPVSMVIVNVIDKYYQNVLIWYWCCYCMRNTNRVTLNISLWWCFMLCYCTACWVWVSDGVQCWHLDSVVHYLKMFVAHQLCQRSFISFQWLMVLMENNVQVPNNTCYLTWWDCIFSAVVEMCQGVEI